MPCMGPSQDAAYAQGEELAKELLAVMKEKGVYRPEFAIIKTILEDWDKHEKQFIAVVKELVWDHEAASF